MIEKKIALNYILGSALIDMYSKCGKIETAKEIFETIQRDDISVWNALINGLAVHGLALDAITIFSRMEVENVSPDSITFVGILTACSHWLVEQGHNVTTRSKINDNPTCKFPVLEVPYGTDKLSILGWRFLSGTDKFTGSQSGGSFVELTSYPVGGSYIELTSMVSRPVIRLKMIPGQMDNARSDGTAESSEARMSRMEQMLAALTEAMTQQQQGQQHLPPLPV
ncbi:hypothetical protein HYC85_028914 [Camellia sinensis]|uniref:Pentatricopeptide repeat-containing protein n=1 Tax=Camellia sinensis TaxID=4442 RepID=A0A7J7FWH9_CAMSI|nr:hypothetical protein HYC85_028914 [Camellia sinensis]